MYHLALAVPTEDEHLDDKLEAVAALPGASESVRVAVVRSATARGPSRTCRPSRTAPTSRT